MKNIIQRSPHYTNFGTWNRLCYAKFALVELLQTSPQLMQKRWNCGSGSRVSGETFLHHINPASFSSTTVVMLELLSTPSNPGQIILLCETPKFRCLSFCKYSGIYTAHKLIEVLIGQQNKLIQMFEPFVVKNFMKP